MMTDQSSISHRLWTKDFILVSLCNLFLFFSYHMLLVTLPLYVVDMGGTEFHAGLVVGLLTLTALLIRPFAGRALDTRNRKHILVGGVIIFTVAIFMFHWMYSIYLLLMVRAFQGIGWGIATTAYGTIAGELVPSRRRAEGMGYFGISINLAMALAPLLGIWIVNAFEFSAMFMVAGASCILGIVLSQYILIPANYALQSKKKPALIEKSAFVPSILIMFVTLAHGGLLSSITLFGKEEGIQNVGWFFLINAIIVMIIRPLTGRIVDTRGYTLVLVLGGLSISIGLLLLSVTGSVFLLIIAAVFYGFGFASIQPTLQAWMIHGAEPERRGAANGTYFSAFDLGTGGGAIFVGFMAQWLNFANVYRVSIIFMMGYGVVYGYYWLKKHKQKKQVNRTTHTF